MTALWAAFLTWLKANVATITLAVALLAAVGVSVLPLTNYAESRATGWLQDLRPPANESTAMQAQFKIETPEVVRLKQQLAEVKRRIAFHARVTAFFLGGYYMALTLAAATGVIAAAMLVGITRVGWEKASMPLKLTFLIMATAGAYFAAFPGLFQQASNIDENRTLHIAYVNLEAELMSYFATGEDRDDKVQSPKAFVHAVDRKLSELNKLPISFNAEKLPVGIDPTEGLGNTSGAN